MQAIEIEWNFNSSFKEVFTTNARIIDICGGRGRGGSHFGTDYFLFLLMQPEYFRGYFMREVYGDIRGSLWQDFKDRLDEKEDMINLDDFVLNESKMSVLYKPTGNMINSKGFKKSSGKSSAKLKSIAGATHVLIEECDEVEEDEFDKLNDSFRTTKTDKIQIIRLYNPPSKNHWLIKNHYNLIESEYPGYYVMSAKNIPGFFAIHSTYEHNIDNINATTISQYENYKNTKPEYYYTQIKGLVSEGAKGRVYNGWQPISLKEFYELPFESYFGLDYGYSEDPNALIEVKVHNNKRWIRKLIYENGLTNPMIADKIKALGIDLKRPIYADSAEQKSNRELRDLKLNVIDALKGPDSVSAGIKHIKGLEVYYVEDTDLSLEYQEYKWALDQNKMPTDTPVDKHNHLMDAFRYEEWTRMFGAKRPKVGRLN